MQRFYIKDFRVIEDRFTVKDVNIVYQLVKVLRTRIGTEIIIFNADDSIDYLCKINDFSKKELDLSLIEKIETDSDLEIYLNLFQAMPNKLDKVEYILQKGVEIGVRNFTFFRSERSQKLAISDKKKERLERIIVEAVEQCGGNYIPSLDLDFDVEDFSSQKGQSIFLHTHNIKSLSLLDYINNIYNKKTRIMNIFVGPEGGFSNDEVSMFEKKYFSRIHLGNRILRTETAGIATVFMLSQMIK